MAMVQEEQEAGIPEWVVTFGDMMSLLLTFFVLLFSMSEIKQEHSRAMLESLRRQFGHDTVPGKPSSANFAMARLTSLGRARRLNTMNGGNKVRAPIGENPRAWAIRPSEDEAQGWVVYFKEGWAELSDPARQTLLSVKERIDGKPQRIEVRGHTSARPLPDDSPFLNHWELAFKRCATVMDYLVKAGMDPDRITLGVAAGNEPVHIDPNPELLEKNARVEILMFPELARDRKGTKTERQERSSTGNTPSKSGA